MKNAVYPNLFKPLKSGSLSVDKDTRFRYFYNSTGRRFFVHNRLHPGIAPASTRLSGFSAARGPANRNINRR